MTRHDPDDLSIAFTTTIDDYAALLRFVSTSPSRIALQALIFAGIGVYLLVLTVLVGLVSAAFDADRAGFTSVVDYLMFKVGDDLRPIAPWIGAACAGLFVTNIFVLVPRQCRLLTKRVLAAYPAVLADDPTMSLDNVVRVSPRGIEGATSHQRIFVAWPLVRRLVERRDRVYVMTSRSTGFILPKAVLADETGKRLLDAIRRHLASSGLAPP